MRIRRHVTSLSFGLILTFVLLGWWNSTRYSERHVVQFGYFMIDTFSATSLFRVSFVKLRSPQWGIRTFYRQPNPRGKFLLRPKSPTLIQRNPDIFEITLGYWHLVLGSIAAIGIAIGLEIRHLRRSGSHLSNSDPDL